MIVGMDRRKGDADFNLGGAGRWAAVAGIVWSKRR
jgi:hypothetical protein